MRGKLYAIEGIDASGKASQAALLAATLGGTLIPFPQYKTVTGQAILSHLQNRWRARHRDPRNDRHLDALALQALMTVNRLEAVPTIEGLLVNGINVVLDRYYASGIVYGTCDDLDTGWLQLIHKGLPQPDRWVLIDIPPEESARRRPERRDRYEAQDGLMARVRAEYVKLFEANYFKGWRTVDGLGTIDQVHERVLDAVGV